MSNLKRNRVIWVVTAIVLCAALFGYLGMSPVGYIHWVGGKDLQITFRILDADSDQGVKGAKVNVLDSLSGFCHEDQKAPFSLVAGDDGIVRYIAKQCMCFGTEGGWGPTRKDTFGSHIPTWILTVEAPGYVTTGPVELETLREGQRVERGKETSLLEVVVKLQKLSVREKPGADERGGK